MTTTSIVAQAAPCEQIPAGTPRENHDVIEHIGEPSDGRFRIEWPQTFDLMGMRGSTARDGPRMRTGRPAGGGCPSG